MNSNVFLNSNQANKMLKDNGINIDIENFADGIFHPITVMSPIGEQFNIWSGNHIVEAMRVCKHFRGLITVA